MGLKNNSIVNIIELLVENRSPLRIQGSEDILLDPITKNPYMPGTSIAGALRRFVDNNFGNRYGEILFGGNEEGRLFVSDSVSENNTGIEVRPGIKIDSKFGGKSGNTFFSRKFISEGHQFRIVLKLFTMNKEENKELLDIIYECINAIHKGEVRLGGEKTNGAGVLSVEDIKVRTLDLKDKKELAEYLLEDYHYKSVKDSVLIGNSKAFATLKVKAYTKTPVFIQGKEQYKDKVGRNIKKKGEKYYIPGSSLKGSVKGRFSEIAKFKGYEELVVKAFGGEVNSQKVSGNIFFQDILIEESKDNVKYNRIKINKFTGGNFTGALMSYIPVLGKVQFSIRYRKTGNEEDKKILAILIYTIRDLLEGLFYIGGGASIGMGELSGEEILLEIEDKEISINLVDNKIVNGEMLEEILKSIN